MNFLHQNTLILLALQALASNKNKAKIALKLLSVPVRIVLFITIVLLANSKYRAITVSFRKTVF
jgi:hypothetical protein